MAGGSASEDEDPVPVNCVALIDIIFCLCIFFMCSFHFKQLEGKLDAWLPREKGVREARVTDPVLEEVRLELRWDAEARRTERRFGARTLGSDRELGDLVEESRREILDLRGRSAPVIIDAEPTVPWHDVIRTMDVVKARNITEIELAAPRPTGAR